MKTITEIEKEISDCKFEISYCKGEIKLYEEAILTQNEVIKKEENKLKRLNRQLSDAKKQEEKLIAGTIYEYKHYGKLGHDMFARYYSLVCCEPSNLYNLVNMDTGRLFGFWQDESKIKPRLSNTFNKVNNPTYALELHRAK